MTDYLGMPTIQKIGNTLHVSHGDDASTFAIFEMDWVPDESMGLDKGTVQGRSIPFVEIRFPGDKTKVIRRPVTAEDKERWPRQWARFEKEGKTTVEGFPIADCPKFTRADVKMLTENGVQTLEQLAAYSDANLPGMWRPYRDIARAMLKAGQDTAAATKLEKENSELRSRIDDLEEQVKRLAVLAEEKTRKAGKRGADEES